jgi:hypothetical protein
MTRDDVESRIDRAFAGEVMPETERGLAEPSIEAKYVIDHFFGRSRSDIDASTFLPSLHMEDFTYMTSKAVAYYLPPVLLLMLNEPYDFELWAHLAGFLRSARREDVKSLRDLSRAQHQAIAHWAEFLVTALDGSFGCDLKVAAKLGRLYRELAETVT